MPSTALALAQFMGIEIPAEYGGTGSSFTAACIMVEELAKVSCAHGEAAALDQRNAKLSMPTG